MRNLVNQKAPDFKLEDQDGLQRSLADFKGKYVLLYFYPKDMTSGCTIEAKKFQDALGKLEKYNVQVLGVSTDDATSHKKFCNKEGLSFPLLADVDKKLVEAFGVWVEKSMYGKKYMGIQRDSFLIDPQGVVVKHYVKVKPEEHVGEVLGDLEEMIK